MLIVKITGKKTVERKIPMHKKLISDLIAYKGGYNQAGKFVFANHQVSKSKNVTRLTDRLVQAIRKQVIDGFDLSNFRSHDFRVSVATAIY